jgi:nitroreductase
VGSSIYRTILARRTVRKFKSGKISFGLLKKFVNAARLAPSAANLQPLEYLVIDSPALSKKIFPHLRWANYITPKGIPLMGKRPVAYIAVLVNKNKEMPGYSVYDVGAAVENILLSAWEKKIGVCWIKSLEKRKLESLLDLPRDLELDSVLALGYRAETPKVEIFKDSVKYWQDSRGRLHVPKRALADILHHNRVRRYD